MFTSYDLFWPLSIDSTTRNPAKRINVSYLVGSAEGAEDAEQLVDLAVPGEECALVQLQRRGQWAY